MSLRTKRFYDTVKEVVTECDNYMDRSQILVLISTVLPGTVRLDTPRV